MFRPATRYAKSGDVHIAYQIFGKGGVDLVVVPGWASHIEHAWNDPVFANFLTRLGSFSRVIWFDKRGTGLSDREVGMPTLEQRMDDVRAVMDAAGSKRADRPHNRVEYRRRPSPRGRYRCGIRLVR